MAKTKKAAQPSEDNAAEVNGRSKPTSNDEKKPAKNLKENFKQHALQKHLPIRDMVNNALKAKASADGVPLVAIRTYIVHNYNNKRKLGKALQDRIKEYIADEFAKGEIVAVNMNDKNIKFNSMRFSMAD